MKKTAQRLTLAAAILLVLSGTAVAGMLGLPPVPYPADNPQTPEKVALGKKLFEDMRLSRTGQVSCATCHDEGKGFTDSPRTVSEGINGLTGTRNAPTVINSAYFTTLFWDGRSPSLEDQSTHPMVNPVEMGQPNHDPVLELVRNDPGYVSAFKAVFGKTGDDVTMDEVSKAIGSFERTVVAGDSPFDRWYFGGDESALTPAQKRGFDIFINQGRCVSCHIIEQTQALFTDNRFHNIGVGINRIQSDIPELAGEFVKARASARQVDIKVLTDKRTSELGRFVVTTEFDGIGAFKTSTLRNIAATAPYMHDGSIKTLRDVVVHYNNGGVTKKDDPVNDYLDGGIRPLGLTDEQIDDLVAFMEALTSPEYRHLTAEAGE